MEGEEGGHILVQATPKSCLNLDADMNIRSTKQIQTLTLHYSPHTQY